MLPRRHPHAGGNPEGTGPQRHESDKCTKMTISREAGGRPWTPA
jgi:hypothetical protein